MSLKAVSFFNILEFMQTFLNHLLIIKSVSNAWIFNDGSIIMILKTLTAWKVSKYGVFSGPYFPEFGLSTERHGVYLRIQSECGKIRTRKTSKFGHSSRSVWQSHDAFARVKLTWGEKGVRCGFPNDFREKKNVKVELIISIRNLFPHFYFVFSLAIIIMFTAQKWSFALRISSVNVTKSARICGFHRIYRRNP